MGRPVRWTLIAALALACGGSDFAESGGRPARPQAARELPRAAGEPAALAGITAAHNAERARVGVEPLAWDSRLAAIAQEWAESCVDRHGPRNVLDHNPNRVAHGETMGENIFAGTGPITAESAVQGWADERAFYDYDRNRCERGEVCGHYTQLVWRSTRAVGCGVSRCPRLDFEYTIVCNYAPAGNDGGRPY
jgi:pathogenesis-related protein 1